MSNINKPKPLLERDPSLLRWAMQDLSELENTPWQGGDVIMTADYISRLRQAAKVVLNAINSQTLVNAEPLREILSATEQRATDSESLAERVRIQYESQTRSLSEEITDLVADRDAQKTQRDLFENAFNQLDGAIDHATEEMGGIELFGCGENPLTSIQIELQTVQSETYTNLETNSLID